MFWLAHLKERLLIRLARGEEYPDSQEALQECLRTGSLDDISYGYCLRKREEYRMQFKDRSVEQVLNEWTEYSGGCGLEI